MGGQWALGVIARLLYALMLVRKGRIGEAVVAHATANGLLAGYVLVLHKWSVS